MVSFRYTAWHRSIQDHLRILFSKIFTKEENVAFNNSFIERVLLDKRAMYYWGLALTPYSYDITDNYEVLETLGDAVMGYCFIKYAISIRTDLNPAEITNLKQKLVSGERQWKTFDSFGLTPFVRSWEGSELIITNKMKTDMIEAFFGAALKIGDLSTKGLGMLICEVMIKKSFPEIADPAHDWEIDQPAKTEILQIFTKLGSDTRNFHQDCTFFTTFPGYSTVIIKLAAPYLKRLRAEGIVTIPAVLATVKEDGLKKPMMVKAYSIARTTLRKYGVTTEWAISVKERDRHEDINPKLLNEAFRAVNGYYDKFEFSFPEKNTPSHKTFCVLIGVKDGQHDVIQSVYIPFDKDKGNKYMSQVEAKTSVLRKLIVEGVYKEL